MDVTYFASYLEGARGVTSRAITCKIVGIWPAMPHRLEQIASPMSALPPKADKEQTCRDVRLVPKADSCTAAKDMHGCMIYSIISSAVAGSLPGTVNPGIPALRHFLSRKAV
jgi:hypothetical protein